MTTRPDADAVKAMARAAGIATDDATAARIAHSIGPAFDGFAPLSGRLPFDLEPATFILVQMTKRKP